MKWKYYPIFLFLLAAASCKQPYNAPVKAMPTGYLVVEGFISTGTTNIQLSRTTTLTDTAFSVMEDGALVSIEGSGNDSFALTSAGNGVYTSTNVTLNNTEQYRLRIVTAAGGLYLSDFETVKSTPPIDSLSWIRSPSGIQLYANTHDPLDTNRYFYWSYTETWEFHSDYVGTLKYVYNYSIDHVIGVTFKEPYGLPDSSIYKCWSSQASTNIITATTENIEPDVVYEQPLLFIPQGAQELSVLFSLSVNQYSVGKGAYQFLQELKNNTENLGTIFDPQPSQLQGNIHCQNNPSEIVVGYVEVSNQQTQRIFISNSQVPGWDYVYVGCSLDTLSNDSVSLVRTGLEYLLPVVFVDNGTAVFTAVYSPCLDCTLTGSNIKPSFWP
jgi:hypothetical protein